jgi:hypothetical protein
VVSGEAESALIKFSKFTTERRHHGRSTKIAEKRDVVNPLVVVHAAMLAMLA